MSRIYFDHAATTPMVPEAVEAMTRELTRVGNASSLHASGRSARRVVEESREVIAAQLGASPAELIFTSGGTESDNLAIKGAFWSRAEVGRRGLVTSAVEHHAVLDSVAWLEHSGAAEVAYVPVDSTGRVDLSALTGMVDTRTALVSVMWANNEVGTLQPDRHDRQRTRRTVTLRRRPGCRPCRARLRGERARPVELHRTQAWWTVRDRCLVGPSRSSVGPDPAWWRSGA